MAMDVYPPRGLLVPGTQQITENSNWFARNTSNQPVDASFWPDAASVEFRTFFRVPPSYEAGGITFTVMRGASVSAGTAKMALTLIIARNNAAATVPVNALAQDFTPGDTLQHTSTYTLVDGSFVPGDVIQYILARNGADAGDTLAGVVYPGGLYVTYNAATPRVFNAQPYEEDSFTVTATGFSGTAPSGTARYVRIGKQVTVHIPELTGTSNATTFALTGIPPALLGASGSSVKVSAGDNGATEAQAVLSLNSMIVYRNPIGSVTWTASGLKTLFNQHISYMLP